MNEPTPKHQTTEAQNLPGPPADRFAGLTLRGYATQGLEHLSGEPNDQPLFNLGIILAEAAVAMGPDITVAGAREMIADALRQALIKHPDLRMHCEAMSIAALGMLPYTSRISWAEFVESIYCIASYADFLQPARWRSQLSNLISEGIQ